MEDARPFEATYKAEASKPADYSPKPPSLSMEKPITTGNGDREATQYLKGSRLKLIMAASVSIQFRKPLLTGSLQALHLPVSRQP